MGEIRHLASYEADWKRWFKKTEGSSGRDAALAGWESFKRLGFPTSRRGSELWKYTDIRAINETKFRRHIPSAKLTPQQIARSIPIVDSWRNIVFIDGHMSGSWGKLREVGPGESEEVERRALEALEFSGSIADVESDPFVALNAAFSPECPIYCSYDDDAPPTQFIWVSTGARSGARANYPRWVVFAQPDTSATLIETHVSLTDQPLLEVPVVEIRLEAGASLNHYRLQLSGNQTYHIGTTRIQQRAGSVYNSVSFATGAAIGRHDIHTHLGEGAEAKLHGLYITNGDEHQSHEVSATHSMPHGTSDQFYKGILSGKSQAVFSGKVVVERGAQKTDAQQKDLNLLLSHGAEIDTKPSLEIYADDVQCGHGATAGHVDEDTLFYLQSRGVDYGAAQAMLIRGFAQEILDEFELPELHEFLTRRVDGLLPQLQATSDTIGTA